MQTPKNNSLRFWLVILVCAAFFFWLFKAALLPFLIGIAIAYILEPAVTLLEKHKIRRWLGSVIVLGWFFVLVTSVFLLLWPIVSDQLGAFIFAFPGYVETIKSDYVPWVQDWLSRFSPEDVQKLRDAAAQSTGQAIGLVTQALQHIVSSGFALIDAIALSVLTPITAFYMLRDWKKMSSVVDQLIPRRQYDVVREQLSEVNRTLGGFMRGQAIVCIILGAFYSAGLALNGLQYGATIGIIAGVLSIMPYVGTVFGWVTSLILAIFQFDGDLLRVGLVVSVFIVGNILESYVLTPRLVGKRVNLHPVWIMFALIAGIKLMGFTGALIAVPLTAVLGVLIRFAARQYKSSALYQ